MESLLKDLGIDLPDDELSRQTYLLKTKTIYLALQEAYKIGADELKNSIENRARAIPKKANTTKLSTQEVRAAVLALTSELKHHYETKQAKIEVIVPKNYRENLLKVLDVLEIVGERGAGYIEVKD